MRETWTCGRCGLTDATVLNLDTGNAYHPEWRNCVAAVQQQLAAARAEVETLTRDRDGWERRTKELGSVVIRSWALLRDWWQYAHLEEREEPFADALARAIAADAEHDKYALAEMKRLRDENGALAADLAAVRKVEEWEGPRGTRIKWVEAPREPQSEWRAWSWGLRATANPRIVATGDSIIALGRALAAQEGAHER